MALALDIARLLYVHWSCVSIQSELNLEKGSRLLPLAFHDFVKRDFRMSKQSPVFGVKCYPRGEVPDVVLGAINVLYFMLMDQPWTVKEGDDAPLTAKLVAASAICVWVCVLFFGHMLPFLGNAF